MGGYRRSCKGGTGSVFCHRSRERRDQLGGDKIVPERVRHLLLEHPKVVDAHIYGKKNPFTGMLLVADVKLASGVAPKTIQNELKEFVRSHLPATHEPKFINIVDDIATNSTGKVTQR